MPVRVIEETCLPLFTPVWHILELRARSEDKDKDDIEDVYSATLFCSRCSLCSSLLHINIYIYIFIYSLTSYNPRYTYLYILSSNTSPILPFLSDSFSPLAYSLLIPSHLACAIHIPIHIIQAVRALILSGKLKLKLETLSVSTVGARDNLVKIGETWVQLGRHTKDWVTRLVGEVELYYPDCIEPRYQRKIG